jgi:hypothetical protein
MNCEIQLINESQHGISYQEADVNTLRTVKTAQAKTAEVEEKCADPFMIRMDHLVPSPVALFVPGSST